MAVLDLDALAVIPSRVRFRSGAGAEAGLCDGGWFLREQGENVVRVFDSDARLLDQIPAPTVPSSDRAPSWQTGPALAVDRGGRRVAVAGSDRLVIGSAVGREVQVSHPRWARFGGAVAFDPTEPGADLLWLAVPSIDRDAAAHTATQPPSGALLLIRADTGTVIDRVELGDDHPELYTLVAAPGRGVILSAGYGQDGSTTWCARTDGHQIELRQLRAAGIPNSFDRLRGEILFLPHNDDHIEVRTWWDNELVTRISGEDLFGPIAQQESYVGHFGAFIDYRRIVVQTLEAEIPLVLDRTNGRPLGRLVLDSDATWPASMAQLAPRRLLCHLAPGRYVALIAIDAPNP